MRRDENPTAALVPRQERLNLGLVVSKVPDF
jgi:hypothetical protein